MRLQLRLFLKHLAQSNDLKIFAFFLLVRLWRTVRADSFGGAAGGGAAPELIK